LRAGVPVLLLKPENHFFLGGASPGAPTTSSRPTSSSAEPAWSICRYGDFLRATCRSDVEPLGEKREKGSGCHRFFIGRGRRKSPHLLAMLMPVLPLLLLPEVQTSGTQPDILSRPRVAHRGREPPVLGHVQRHGSHGEPSLASGTLVLHCAVMHCTVLQCTVLFCI